MSTPIISVENLSKRYQLGQIGATTLRDSAQRLWLRFRGRNPDHDAGNITTTSSSDSGAKSHPSPIPASSDNLWALRNVSFEVQSGEVFGIIGRNGAGKSTLLKILSRITEPTSGRAVMRGRVASLLEVGTGFHPELSGRENVYLNGAILGMKKAEIDQKFDEIVDFAGVDRFIDTPVKRYSSGMYVRLAFAVAAHLEPEILLVDEVLAVGDAEFQAKCLGKMDEVSKGGRTVLFISHNMAAVKSLCSRCARIQNGALTDIGNTEIVVDRYLADIMQLTHHKEVAERQDRTGNGAVRITKMSVQFDKREACWVIHVSYHSVLREWDHARLLVSINTPFNTTVTFLDSACLPSVPKHWPPNGEVSIRLSPDVLLANGDYLCNVACLRGAEIVDHVSDACSIHVSESSPFGWCGKPMSSGSCHIRQTWTIGG